MLQGKFGSSPFFGSWKDMFEQISGVLQRLYKDGALPVNYKVFTVFSILTTDHIIQCAIIGNHIYEQIWGKTQALPEYF